MTDRELLELAAKAAGIKTHLHKESNSLWIDGPRTWNPLTDDGDALRLAVKLGLLGAPFMALEFIAATGDSDPYAAIRLAIVRAAADIGRNMP